MPRSVLEKFAAVQMIDVHLPTTDGNEFLLTRYRTQAQPVAEEAETGTARPTTTQNHRQRARATHPAVVPTLGRPPQQSQILRSFKLQSAKLGWLRRSCSTLEAAPPGAATQHTGLPMNYTRRQSTTTVSGRDRDELLVGLEDEYRDIRPDIR